MMNGSGNSNWFFVGLRTCTIDTCSKLCRLTHWIQLFVVESFSNPFSFGFIVRTNGTERTKPIRKANEPRCGNHIGCALWLSPNLYMKFFISWPPCIKALHVNYKKEHKCHFIQNAWRNKAMIIFIRWKAFNIRLKNSIRNCLKRRKWKVKKELFKTKRAKA